METGYQIWSALIATLALCSTGFFFLLRTVNKTSVDVAKPLQEIRDALLGTLSPRKPGLFSDFYQMREDIEKFKEQCEKRHEQSAR